MTTCDECGEKEGLGYSCNYCSGNYCSKHRLPENHNCKTQRVTTQPSYSGTPSPLFNWVLLPLYFPLFIARTYWKPLVIFALVFGGVFAVGGYPPEDFEDSPAAELLPNTNRPTQVGPEGTPGPADYSGLEGDLRADLVEQHIHRFINQERQKNGRSNLTYDNRLSDIARYHSEDMAIGGYFSHKSPAGETMENRYEKFQYDCRVSTGSNSYATGGENIAKTYAFVSVETKSGVEHYDTETELARGLVNQWMNSEDHRENLLQGYWTSEGIGVYIVDEGPGPTVFATQNFC